ncbi:MAG: hypothetical protein ACR2QC_02840 [Gammaproteobacteria bacterium]
MSKNSKNTENAMQTSTAAVIEQLRANLPNKTEVSSAPGMVQSVAPQELKPLTRKEPERPTTKTSISVFVDDHDWLRVHCAETKTSMSEAYQYMLSIYRSVVEAEKEKIT